MCRAVQPRGSPVRVQPDANDSVWTSVNGPVAPRTAARYSDADTTVASARGEAATATSVGVARTDTRVARRRLTLRYETRLGTISEELACTSGVIDRVPSGGRIRLVVVTQSLFRSSAGVSAHRFAPSIQRQMFGDWP